MSNTIEKEVITFPFEVTSDYIVLLPIEDAEKSEGGIFIPEQARRPLNYGTVVKIGETLMDTPENELLQFCKIGTKVVFPLHVEHRIQHKRTTFYIIKADDVICYLPA
jgi:co-chaperonin GroES (HSP10)